MTLRPMVRHGSLAVALLSALTLPLIARAGAFQLPTDNAAGWARADAGGSLFPDDPTAAYNNPAAMAFFTGSMFQVTGIQIRPSAVFHGQTQDVDGNPTTGGNPNGFGKFVPFPNVAWAVPVTDRLTLGGALTVPFGLESQYNSSWRGRYFGTETYLETANLSFSAAFKLNDQFSLGLGVLGQYTKASLDTVADPYGAAQALFGLPLPPQQADVQLNVNARRKFSFGYLGGLVYKPTDQDTFGISYHSRIGQTLSGSYNLYGSTAGKQLLAEAPLLDPALPSINPNGGPVSAVFDTPAFASADWLHAFTDRLSIAGTIKRTQWSSFQDLVLTSNGQTIFALPERFKNSMTYAVGGDYKLSDAWTLHAGVGFDETPTNVADRDPRVPDADRKLLGLGLGYKVSEKLSFDVGYQHEFVNNARVNMTNQPILGAGSINGYFTDTGDILSLTGTYRF
ncbi:OmpP1/FadL family transporter [Dyella sp.]|uniref:OmpP1/FadL family transporter n=1 Tax=Dyella sp. TaxID=1869338 RepID=UPI002CEFD9C5|nr:outer membrane protein transport protein [Dyella sp.]HTC26996.1 outer membrane protein transport protein [Dyella sp.]